MEGNRQTKVLAWAPYRIDAGGTWDIKALALPFERHGPVTLNLALDLGVEVEILPFTKGLVRIRSPHYPALEGKLGSMAFNSPLGLFAICLSHFGIEDIAVEIRPALPPGSALGGSSSALIALLVALREHLQLKIDDEGLVTLAYHMEDIHQSGGAGMQDHLAAMYGGAHLWRWTYSSYPFFKGEGLPSKTLEALKERILVAFVGSAHFSPGLNRSFVSDFMEGRQRGLWLEANEIVKELWQAIQKFRWEEAARLLRQETQLRKVLTKDAFNDPFLVAFIDKAEETGCGARFTGAGSGGCVWALGEADRIRLLKEKWLSLSFQEQGAILLDTRPSEKGAWAKRCLA